MEKEEGEMSDDNAMLVDDNKEIVEADVNSTVLYKVDKNGIIVQQLEKIDAAKLDERAQRFGLNLTGNKVVTQKQIDDLYSNFGIEDENKRHFRFDALHLSSVEGLNTREIFEYLEDYKPMSLEWIDNISCNVVCQDHVSVALALLVHSREIKDAEIKKLVSEKSGQHWREGVPHPKKDLILMRFATNSDKKMNKKSPHNTNQVYDHGMDSASKNPWGDLCKSWGIYDHQEIFQRKLPKHDYEDESEETSRSETVKIKNKSLAMRLGKRSHHVDQSDDSSDSDSEWKKKSKTPRMRMHADDEESKLNNRKKTQETIKTEKDTSYAPLSIEVVNSHNTYTQREYTKLSDKFRNQGKNMESKKDGIQSRLGVKVPHDKSWSSEDSDSDHNITSRVHKVNSALKGNSNVWARLDKPSGQSDLRNILKSRQQKKPDDLRDRISKSKQSNLRIEIDNN